MYLKVRERLKAICAYLKHKILYVVGSVDILDSYLFYV